MEKRGGWIEDDQGLRSLKGAAPGQTDDDADDFGEMIDAR